MLLTFTPHQVTALCPPLVLPSISLVRLCVVEAGVVQLEVTVPAPDELVLINEDA